MDDTAEAVVVLSVDQPSPAWVTQRLIEKWRETGAKVVLPRFGGRGGHPVLLAGALLPDLRRVTDRTMGLRAVVDANRDHLVSVDLPDTGINVNLNTPSEYRAALAALERGDWAEPA